MGRGVATKGEYKELCGNYILILVELHKAIHVTVLYRTTQIHTLTHTLTNECISLNKVSYLFLILHYSYERC